jgi:uncharacterized protein YdeI (YjbR/CyaY-like superfamily)
MNTSAELYFIHGCGRCPLGGTPDCKVHTWAKELEMLRHIILETGLVETCKWGVPCYLYQEKNVLILGAFKDYCFVSFFKGALLQDQQGILEKQGEQSQAGRLIRFTQPARVRELESDIRSYIFEAIEVEKAGLTVQLKTIDEYDLPDELILKMEELPGFKAAFQALTPGRQRGYIIYFSQPKQSATRMARIEKSMDQIYQGIGIHDYMKQGKGGSKA